MNLTEETKIAIETSLQAPAASVEVIAALESGGGGGGGGGGSSAVSSVAGRTGDVILTKSDVGLSFIDNTSDINKPVSSATQTALNAKATDTSVVHVTGAETIAGVKTFTSTIVASINGNAATTTNGVVTTGSYSDPTWITTLAGSKITGNISGNAAGLTGNISESQVTNLVSDLALKAPLASPVLTGIPTAPTASGSTNTTQIATTAFVQSAIGGLGGGTVTSVFSRSGVITATTGDYTVSQVTGAAPLASPSFTGTVTLGTLTGLLKGSTGVVSVASAGTDYLTPGGNGSALTGITESQVTNLVSDLAAKANDSSVVHVTGAETIAGVKTFTSTIVGSIDGNANTVTNGVVTTGSYADPSWITSLAGSKITGNISGNTSGTAAGLSANIAESQVTNLVSDLALKAPLVSPVLTGVPTAPTAAGSTNTTQVATTAFVQAAIGSSGAVTSVFSRSGVVIATSGDYTVSQVTGAAPLASPSFTGTVTVSTLTGIIKAATGALSVATEGTDYLSGASASIPEHLSFSGTGTPTAGADKSDHHRIPYGATGVRIDLSTSTAPSGTFQVTWKRSSDGGSTFPDTIGSPTIASGNKDGTTTTFANAALAAGDILRIDIDSVNGAGGSWHTTLWFLSKNR